MVNIEEIRRRAAEIGLTIASLERKADLGNGVIGNWGTASPRLDTLQRVAAVLGCGVDDLLKKETA